MIHDQKMIAEAAEMMCEQSICSVQFNIRVPTPETASVSIDVLSISEKSAVSCAASIKTTVVGSTPTRFSPSIRSGSHTDIGPRRSNEDQHIRIDDLSKHLGDVYKWGLPSSFYAIFDGHGGAEAASYVKQHAMRLFFEDSDLHLHLPASASDVLDELFLKQVEESHYKAFLLADQALADECSASDYCGTTALTVLIMGRHLVIANAGDCRAVLCRKGVAKQMSQDHRPSTCLQEKKRVEQLGGYFDQDGYLNGQLAVTRALGDWHMKKNSSPLIAEPEVRQMMLCEEDEFMIIGCDGIWDVMSNQEAVALVRCQLRQHNDPQRSAVALVNQALHLHTSDNITAIVVCFSSHTAPSKPSTQYPNSRLFRKKPLISSQVCFKAV